MRGGGWRVEGGGWREEGGRRREEGIGRTRLDWWYEIFLAGDLGRGLDFVMQNILEAAGGPVLPCCV